MSLAKIQEPPEKGLILLTGVPGAGKSTFCHQVAIRSIASERPVIFVTTEQNPADITEQLHRKGMTAPMELNFVDAFSETVGLATAQRPDTVLANCADLNSLSIAITKQRENIGQQNTLLVFDSLTSPYLFNGAELVKFIRIFLSKFSSEGNPVLALVDEGCGKEEDLGAMMSFADGILRMEIKDDSRVINVVKHPSVEPSRIEVPVESSPTIKSSFDAFKSSVLLNPERMMEWTRSMSGQAGVSLRKEVGDYVNMFWMNFARWSTMLWDPKGFPAMIYDLNKEDAAFAVSKEMIRFSPRLLAVFIRFLLALQTLGLFPKHFGKVKDMKKYVKGSRGGPWRRIAEWERSGNIEYIENVSSDDEHYFRVYENADCWGFENVGVTMASHLPPHMAGQLIGFEKNGGEWNAIETRCIGLGDPYCEFKLVPGKISELRSSLEKDASDVERIHERLMERLMGFLLDDRPLVNRPGLGNDVHLHPVIHGFGFPYLVMGGERYRMALRMGGAIAGKKLGERLIEAGLDQDESIKRVIHFLEYCKVGVVSMDETIIIRENCENFTSWLSMDTSEPSCFFTTGFLNGLFLAIKGKRVREVRCAAAGDPYCEWEII